MLTKNFLLEEIVTQLATVKISDTVLVDEFKKTGKTATQGKSFHGVLGEMHMRLALREVCQQYGKRVQFQPIPFGAETERYRFKKSYTGTLAVFRKFGKFRKRNKQQHGEFDDILLADELPVVFESKLHGNKPHLDCYETRSQKKINCILEPVRQYFHQQACGYVLMVYPSQLHSPHPVQQEFIDNGGILVPYPKDWQEHRRETQELFKILSV